VQPVCGRKQEAMGGRNKKRNDELVSKALKHKWLIMVHACSTIPDVLTDNQIVAENQV
jgi:hypothetical protein